MGTRCVVILIFLFIFVNCRCIKSHNKLIINNRSPSRYILHGGKRALNMPPEVESKLKKRSDRADAQWNPTYVLYITKYVHIHIYCGCTMPIIMLRFISKKFGYKDVKPVKWLIQDDHCSVGIVYLCAQTYFSA